MTNVTRIFYCLGIHEMHLVYCNTFIRMRLDFIFCHRRPLFPSDISIFSIPKPKPIMEFRIDRVHFVAFVVLLSTTVFKCCESVNLHDGLSPEDSEALGENGDHQNQTRGARDEPEITLISFLQQSVSKYGEKKVANAIHELAQRSLYDLVWLLAGDLELWLIADLYKLYNAANSDTAVLSVYERFKAGHVNRTIVPEVFALDKKYNEYEWYKRVRSRLLDSTDKYIAGTLKVTNTPPKIEFAPDGKPIISGKPEEAVAAVVTTTVKTTTPEYSDPEYPEDPEDTEDSDILDFLGSLVSRD